MVEINSMTDKLIGVVVFIALLTGVAPIFILYLIGTNESMGISNSGIVLASIVATIGGILFGVFALKGMMKQLG